MDEAPAPHRVVWAFAAAPAAGALTLGLIMAAVTGSLAVGLGIAAFGLLLVGYPAALVLGLPAWLALRHRLRLTPLRCAGVGAAIAGLPILVMFGAVMVADGASARDLESLVMVGIAAVAGAVGGLVFWAAAAWRPRRSA